MGTQGETREQVIGFYQRVWEHADETIKDLPIDALGHVPWWPRPNVKLFNMMVHVLQDTAARETYRAKIEQAVRAAAGGSS